jgi:hypothetical protein
MPVRHVRGRVAMKRDAIFARAALVLACGCRRETLEADGTPPAAPGLGRDPDLAWLVVDSSDEAPVDAPRFVPSDAVVNVVRSGGRIFVAIAPRVAANQVRVEVPGACPLVVASSELAGGATVRRTLTPWIDLRAPQHPSDVGYGARFAVEAVPGCSEAAEGVLAWRQIAGPAVRDAHTDARGLRFEARLASASDLALEVPTWGIVPVSPRTSAEVVIEAEWRPTHAGAAGIVRRRLRLAAASRSRGLPTIALDSGVLLAGSGWSVTTSPPGAAAALHQSGGLAQLIPDVPGRWVLQDATGRPLSIRAGRYDDTPLDCGRSGCHAAIADAAARSAMTFALRSRVEAAGTSAEVKCALACHATGELGTCDGGFTDVARELHGSGLGAGDWAAVPRALRRLGGVTCLACHGPGAIPEASARWAILRADVCATCHDAPPTYGHVAAWRSSRMARADADLRARSDGACAQCHTTSGFLAAARAEDGTSSVRPARGRELDPRSAPSEAGPIGIACAACHAVHDEPSAHDGASAGALVREVRLPAALDGVSIAPASRVCVPCHAPDNASSPSASAAAIWAGRAGVDPDTGTMLVSTSVHSGVARGCLGCHRAGPAGIDRGAGHAFAPDLGICAACHAGAVPDGAAIERAIQRDAGVLFAKLVELGAVGRAAAPARGGPRHAAGVHLGSDRLGRAAYDVMLVLEDPAAAVHNAPYAHALLEAARKVIGGQP